VRPIGDDGDDMEAARHIHDDVIEAIIRGKPVPGVHEPVVAFARQVRAIGEGPVPAPSAELAALLGGRARPRLRLVGSTRLAGASPGGRSGRNRMLGIDRAAGITGKVAGLSLVAKLGLGTSLAAAGVAGAGAAGVMPTAANNAVRGAIEVVSPLEFGPHDDDTPTDNFGNRVSADATGDSDGVNGVEGRQIADDAPGAVHRPDPGAVDESPGQSGDPGLARANDTPAAPHAPDSLPPAASEGDPDGDGVPGQAQDQGTGSSVPSTVPDRGPADDTVAGG
jgi:hypothetical protein